MIVRWGLAELPVVLDELSISRPLLISTERWRDLQLPVHDRFHGVRAHAEIAGVTAAREAVRGADGLIALGGGSTIDTAKAAGGDLVTGTSEMSGHTRILTTRCLRSGS